MSQAGIINAESGPLPADVLETLTGNSGGAVSPDTLHNINIVGTGGVTVTGDPTTHTLSIAGAGAATITIDTDNGSATGTTLNLLAYQGTNACGASVIFSATASTIDLNITDLLGNMFLGLDCGNQTLTGAANTVVGGFGSSGSSLTSGGQNVVIGGSNLPLGTTSNFNTSIGFGNLGTLLTGQYNVALGYFSGDNYTSSESSNILLNSDGVLGESNVLRIGQGTGTGSQQLSKAYICGINGVNVGSTATVVTENTDQLGTAVITAGSGITVTPSANAITIAASGSFINSWVSQGTSVTAVAGTGYFTSALIIITLPAAPNMGDTVGVSVCNVANIFITAGTLSQTIRIGSNTQVGGSIQNTNRGDTLILTYNSVTNEWIATSVIGNWSGLI